MIQNDFRMRNANKQRNKETEREYDTLWFMCELSHAMHDMQWKISRSGPISAQ